MRHWWDSKPGAIHAAAHSVRSGRPDALPTELINDFYKIEGLAILNDTITVMIPKTWTYYGLLWPNRWKGKKRILLLFTRIDPSLPIQINSNFTGQKEV